MNKHYIYNCLLKNDINLVWLASLLSLFHCIYFYEQESLWSISIVSTSLLLSSIALSLSIRMKVILNLHQHVASFILAGVIFSLITWLQYQTNDISTLFIMTLAIVGIIFSGVSLKNLLGSSKLEGLPENKKLIDDMTTSDVIGIYKLDIYEVIRQGDDLLDKKYSLFFDYRLNMSIDKYDMTSMINGKIHSLHDFATHCKENNINLSTISKEDFEVFNMMII